MKTRLLVFSFFLVGLLSSCRVYSSNVQIVNIVATKILPGRTETKPYYEIKIQWITSNSCEWMADISGSEKKFTELEGIYRLRLDSYQEGASIFIYCLDRPNRKTKLILPPLSRPITRQ